MIPWQARDLEIKTPRRVRRGTTGGSGELGYAETVLSDSRPTDYRSDALHCLLWVDKRLPRLTTPNARF